MSALFTKLHDVPLLQTHRALFQPLSTTLLVFSLSFSKPIKPNGLPQSLVTYQGGHIIKRECISSSFSICQVTRAPWIMMKHLLTFLFLPPPCWHFFFSGLDLVHKITTAVSLYVQLFCCAQKTLFTCIHPVSLVLTIFLPPPLQNPCMIWGRDVVQKLNLGFGMPQFHILSTLFSCVSLY